MKQPIILDIFDTRKINYLLQEIYRNQDFDLGYMSGFESLKRIFTEIEKKMDIKLNSINKKTEINKLNNVFETIFKNI